MEKNPSLCFVNGQWVGSRSGASSDVRNPATNALLATVPALEEQEVDQAIAAAHQAFLNWRSRPARERANFLRKIGDLLLLHQDACAHTITAEQGKPLKESRGEVVYAANYFSWFAEEALRVYGDIIPADDPSKRIFVMKHPIGVVGAITPWNFPLAMLARKLAAALAAGCTCVAKPAPETPLTALFLASVCEEAQLPAGVVNILTGDAELIGARLMQSDLVKKVTFTGSTEVGKLLIRQSADTVKKLTLELGGNAPCIIFDDADLMRAMDGILFGKYRNAGQTCVCINRFLVHEAIAADFSRLLCEHSKQLRVGNGADESTDIGPLISDVAVEKVQNLVTDALSHGAVRLTDSPSATTNSRCMSPIVLGKISPSMKIWSEEIFGPVSTITTFSNDREAIDRANDTCYGLAAYIYSGDLSRALRVGEQLEFGMVGINDTAISAVQAPFGGIKQSGFGREGSRYGLDEYLTLQYMSVRG